MDCFTGSIKKGEGPSFNQLVVPNGLRRQVMFVNHESAFSGHLWVKKTEVRIPPNFFWPGLCQDVIRFYHSCDVSQRTVKRGSQEGTTRIYAIDGYAI